MWWYNISAKGNAIRELSLHTALPKGVSHFILFFYIKDRIWPCATRRKHMSPRKNESGSLWTTGFSSGISSDVIDRERPSLFNTYIDHEHHFNYFPTTSKSESASPGILMTSSGLVVGGQGAVHRKFSYNCHSSRRLLSQTRLPLNQCIITRLQNVLCIITPLKLTWCMKR